MTVVSPSVEVRSRRLASASTAVIVGAASLVIWSAIIHLNLWRLGYRHIPDIGRLFLAQGVVGFAVAGAAVAWRRPLTAVAGAVFLVTTAAGLILSATVGVFHFHDGLDAPYAGLSLAVQGAGVCLFVFELVLQGVERKQARRR